MTIQRPAGDFDTSYEEDTAVIRRRWQWGVLLAFLALLFALPAFAPAWLVSLLNRIGIAVIAVQGLNILTGYTGQISLGQAAFMTVGGYLSALLVGEAGWSFFLALPVAALGAGMVGLLFGLPSLRVKGFYLVMATLSAQFIIPWAARNGWRDVLGGTVGLAAPVPLIKLPVINNLCLLGSQFDPALGTCVYRLATPRQFWPATLLILIISTIIAHNISRTRLGRAFVSIRDNDLAAELMGVNLFRYKLRAFFLAAVYAGVAGALLAHNLRRIDAATLGLVDSIWFLGMLVVGGMGSSLGPILGAALITLLEELATVLAPTLTVWFPQIAGGAAAALRPLLFGLALMLFLIFEPRGLAYRWTLLKAAWRLRPFSN